MFDRMNSVVAMRSFAIGFKKNAEKGRPYKVASLQLVRRNQLVIGVKAASEKVLTALHTTQSVYHAIDIGFIVVYVD